MKINKKEMIYEIMEFRFSLNQNDMDYVNPNNKEFVSFIENEYKKSDKKELQEELDYYINLIHCS